MSVCSWIPQVKKIERTKEEQRERPCRRIRLQCTKCTVWPRNAKIYYEEQKRFYHKIGFRSKWDHRSFYYNLLHISLWLHLAWVVISVIIDTVSAKM